MDLILDIVKEKGVLEIIKEYKYSMENVEKYNTVIKQFEREYLYKIKTKSTHYGDDFTISKLLRNQNGTFKEIKYYNFDISYDNQTIRYDTCHTFLKLETNIYDAFTGVQERGSIIIHDCITPDYGEDGSVSFNTHIITTEQARHYY